MTALNLVSGYGGVGDDSTSNDTPFQNFRTDARAAVDTVTLTIPPGTYRTTNMGTPFDGIKNLVVNGDGATWKYMAGSPRLTTNGGFVISNSTKVALVNTVRVDQESCACLTPSEASRFPVGRYAFLTALEKQGGAGFPPNHHYNQSVKILSADTNTGIITFTPPAKFDFVSTYPKTYTDGAAYVTGGPACLMLMDSFGSGVNTGLSTGWDCDVEINGLNVINAFDPDADHLTQHQIYIPGRRVVLNDMTFTLSAPIMTENRYVQLNRITVPDVQIEVDKQIEYFEINDSEVHRLHFQSSSVHLAVVNGLITPDLSGTPKNIVIRNSTIGAFAIGPQGYGNTDSVEVYDSVVSTITAVTSNRLTTADFSWEPGGSLIHTGAGIMNWGAEGSQLFLAGQHSGGSNYAHIGFPTWVRSFGDSGGDEKLFCWLKQIAPSFLTGTVYVVQHPCRSVTFRNVTGCPEAVDLSNAPAGLPLYSYCLRTDQNFLTAQPITMWGALVYLKVNVTRAYTGAQSSALLHAGAQFDNAPIIDASGSFTSFGPIINTKVAGLRTITPTSVTGGQSGDVLGSAPGNISFVNQVGPFLNANMSGDTDGQKPLVTFEMLTDQFQVVGRLM